LLILAASSIQGYVATSSPNKLYCNTSFFLQIKDYALLLTAFGDIFNARKLLVTVVGLQFNLLAIS